MIFALATGTLFRPPEQRTAKSGRSYAVAVVKTVDPIWIRVTAFSESAETALMRLSDGDPVSIQGQLKVETYVASDGTTRPSLSIVASQVLPLKQLPKQREVKTKTERQRGEWRGPDNGPDDGLNDLDWLR